MKVVFQYLKPFAFILLLCVLLLFGQALSDLSLPNLMSDIVNIGLQKNGIDEPVPEQISDDDMVLLAREVSKRIENELEYPGQIKVNVIRESRVTDYAK